MSHRIRIHKPSPRPCEHHCIAALSPRVAGLGRCMDCQATVSTPFALHGTV